MISITKATQKDFQLIVNIGKVVVGEAHKNAAPVEDMKDYLQRNYNDDAIKEELSDPNNIYHIINYNSLPVGFSKITFNAAHPNIVAENITMLDRIYLLKEFSGLKLGMRLLNFNIVLSKDHGQAGIWLYTWVGNERAINFYQKAGFTIIGSHHFYVTPAYYNVNHQMYLPIPASH